MLRLEMCYSFRTVVYILIYAVLAGFDRLIGPGVALVIGFAFALAINCELWSTKFTKWSWHNVEQ